MVAAWAFILRFSVLIHFTNTLAKIGLNRMCELWHWNNGRLDLWLGCFRSEQVSHLCYEFLDDVISISSSSSSSSSRLDHVSCSSSHDGPALYRAPRISSRVICMLKSV